MTLGQVLADCFRKYFVFSGRASRKEYWCFFAFCLLGLAVAYGVESLINTATGATGSPRLLSGAFKLAVVTPFLAVTWRRFHDVGRSGLNYLGFGMVVPLLALAVGAGVSQLMSLVPGLAGTGGPRLFVLIALAGSFAMVIHMLARPGEPGENQYGFNPLEART